MKQITLTLGLFANVDDADYEWLNQWKWYAHKEGRRYYAERNTTSINGIRVKIKMHRFILGTTESSIHVDHIDNDGLNNQRHNLRACSLHQNLMNMRPHVDGSSKFRGLSWHANRGKWHVRIQLNKKSKHIGYFDSEAEGAAAYNIEAQKLFSEYAYLNKVK